MQQKSKIAHTKKLLSTCLIMVFMDTDSWANHFKESCIKATTHFKMLIKLLSCNREHWGYVWRWWIHLSIHCFWTLGFFLLYIFAFYFTLCYFSYSFVFILFYLVYHITFIVSYYISFYCILLWLMLILWYGQAWLVKKPYYYYYYYNYFYCKYYK